MFNHLHPDLRFPLPIPSGLHQHHPLQHPSSPHDLSRTMITLSTTTATTAGSPGLHPGSNHHHLLLPGSNLGQGDGRSPPDLDITPPSVDDDEEEEFAESGNSDDDCGGSSKRVAAVGAPSPGGERAMSPPEFSPLGGGGDVGGDEKKKYPEYCRTLKIKGRESVIFN